MAGFEVVVRPVVFPDIRPRARQSLPPQDDPEKGIAVIKGNPAQSVGLSDTWSVSTSRSRPQETQRRVDEVRVYQKEDGEGGEGGGTVNKDNYVDLEVPNKIWMKDAKDTTASTYIRVEEGDNVEIRNTDIIKKNPNYKR